MPDDPGPRVPPDRGTTEDHAGGALVLPDELGEKSASAAPPLRPRDREERSAVWLQSDQLLPAVCPACLAPGVRGVRVPWLDGALERSAPRKLEGLYCEICASAIERRRTEALGALLSGVVFTATLTLASVLAFGALGTPLTLLLGALLGATPLLLVRAHHALLGPAHALYVARVGEADALELVLRERRYAGSIGERRSYEGPAPRQPAYVPLVPGIVGAALLGLAELSLGATVRVIAPGTGRHTLLVDGRKLREVEAVRREFAGAGDPTRIMAGRRRFTVITARGEVLLDETRPVWPKDTFVLGQPTAGLCLFVETRLYGEAGPGHTLVPWSRASSAEPTPTPIDQWFSPLPEEPALETTGGKRSALRLLSCDAVPGDAPPGARQNRTADVPLPVP